MKALAAWGWFVIVQLVMLATAAVGLVLLAPLCAAHSWVYRCQSINPTKPYRVLSWRWKWVDAVWGNPEDGVVPLGILADYWELAWQAYCWSALRNSADALKYVFAWSSGPLHEGTLWGFSYRAGWEPYPWQKGLRVPVLSVQRTA